MSDQVDDEEELDPELQKIIREAVLRGYRKGRKIEQRKAFVRGMVLGYQVGQMGLDLGIHIPDGMDGDQQVTE